MTSSIAHRWSRPSQTIATSRGSTSQVGLSLLVSDGCCAACSSVLTPASLYLPLHTLAGLPSGNVVANLGDMTMGEKSTPTAERRQIRRQATTGHLGVLSLAAHARVSSENTRARTPYTICLAALLALNHGVQLRTNVHADAHVQTTCAKSHTVLPTSVCQVNNTCPRPSTGVFKRTRWLTQKPCAAPLSCLESRQDQFTERGFGHKKDALGVQTV